MTQNGGYAAKWIVPTTFKVHEVNVEHSGLFPWVVINDGDQYLKSEFLFFKKEHTVNFFLREIPCELIIKKRGLLSYTYSLKVEGNTYDEHCQKVLRNFVVWDNDDSRICFVRNEKRVYLRGRPIRNKTEVRPTETIYHFRHTIAYEIHETNNEGVFEYVLRTAGGAVFQPNGDVFEVQPVIP